MAVDLGESKKRRREKLAIYVLATLLIAFLVAEYWLSRRPSAVPVGQSVLLFSLININLIIFVILIFFSFRNVAKIFLEGGRDGRAPLRKKLVMAFTLFATVPTLLLSATSVYYVYQSFEKWFSDRIISSFEKSLQVTQAYYQESDRRSEHWAQTLVQRFEENDGRLLRSDEETVRKFLRASIEQFDVDWIEVYLGMPPRRLTEWRDSVAGDSAFHLSQEEMNEVREAGRSRFISLMEGGELSRVTLSSTQTPFKEWGLIVSVGNVIPLLISEKTGSISLNLSDYQKLLPFQKTVKTTFLITLMGIVLLILFFSSWLGFHISKRLLKPLEELTEATKSLTQGQWKSIDVEPTFAEYRVLLESFNEMSQKIHEAQTGLENANAQLQFTNQALEHEKSFLEVLVKSINFGVLALDASGNLTIANSALLKLLGISSLPETYKDLQLVLSQLLPSLTRQMQDMFSGRTIRKCQLEEESLIGGRHTRLQIIGVPLSTKLQAFSGIVFIFEDLTEIQTIQRSLAWKEVARRLAHEFKNPLTPIRLSAERLQRNAENLTPEKVQTATKAIMMSVDQLTQLVNEFAQYAKLPEIELRPASMNEVVQNTVAMYLEAHPKVQFKISLDSSVPHFLFDDKQIGRAVSNVIKNSVEAMGPLLDGVIEISSNYSHRLGLVTLVVSDNGPGIPDDVAKKLFQPYFSTRQEGTGLGLAIVQKIVHDHQGSVRVQRNTPRGTRFVFDLPVRGIVRQHAPLSV